jgi:hypothetical protein
VKAVNTLDSPRSGSGVDSISTVRGAVRPCVLSAHRPPGELTLAGPKRRHGSPSGHAAGDAQGDGAGLVDAVGADAVVGVGAGAEVCCGSGRVDRGGGGSVGQ